LAVKGKLKSPETLERAARGVQWDSNKGAEAAGGGKRGLGTLKYYKLICCTKDKFRQDCCIGENSSLRNLRALTHSPFVGGKVRNRGGWRHKDGRRSRSPIVAGPRIKGRILRKRIMEGRGKKLKLNRGRF